MKLYCDEHAFNPMKPVGLQNKVWFDIMFYVCRRGRENLREITRETIVVSTDSLGQKFIFQKLDEADKNHTHSAVPDDTVGEARICEIPGSSMYPVLSFENYISKLSPEQEGLWQRPVNSFTDQDEHWYVNAPVHRKKLQENFNVG